jgi:hypothetical protein
MTSNDGKTYPVGTAELAYGGLSFPVSKGIAILDGDNAYVVARVDKPFPYGKNDDNSPTVIASCRSCAAPRRMVLLEDTGLAGRAHGRRPDCNGLRGD